MNREARPLVRQILLTNAQRAAHSGDQCAAPPHQCTNVARNFSNDDAIVRSPAHSCLNEKKDRKSLLIPQQT